MPKTIFRALAALMACALLTACAREVADDAPEPEPTVTQTPEPTEPEVVLPVNGEALTTVEQVAAAREAGFGVYTMNDGTKVAIDPSQPLPQPVVDEGIAGVLADWNAQTSGQIDFLEADANTGSFIQETGKNIAFIPPLYGSEEAFADPTLFWSVAGTANPRSPLYYRDSGYPGGTGDVESQVAWAEQWVATRPASEAWQIIVTPTP